MGDDTVAISNALPDFAGRRLLLVAPHPDDESLALGGLIQYALRQEASVTVLHVTDGDNNPWPQRWLEKRWRIRSADRQRWGARRVAEARQAMARLGLDPAASVRMQWPDMGVGQRLVDEGSAAMDAFAEVLRDAAPDVVVLPALHDRHPDHGACHVLMRLAMARLRCDADCLTYLVHGADNSDASLSVSITLDADMHEHKRQAVLAHRTQVALARKRLLAQVGNVERLDRLTLPERAASHLQQTSFTLPWRPSRVLHPWLRLTLVHGGGVQAWALRDAPLRLDANAWRLQLPEAVPAPAFARLEMRTRSVWIFDHWGWCDLTAAPASGQAVA